MAIPITTRDRRLPPPIFLHDNGYGLYSKPTVRKPDCAEPLILLAIPPSFPRLVPPPPPFFKIPDMAAHVLGNGAALHVPM